MPNSVLFMPNFLCFMPDFGPFMPNFDCFMPNWLIAASESIFIANISLLPSEIEPSAVSFSNDSCLFPTSIDIFPTDQAFISLAFSTSEIKIAALTRNVPQPILAFDYLNRFTSNFAFHHWDNHRTAIKKDTVNLNIFNRYIMKIKT